MKIFEINPGSFKLDGGATFGVIPKKMWEKVYPADENNLCKFALRSLLIQTEEQLVLIDTGIGDKQDETFLKHYYLEGHHSIVKSIADAGFRPEEITDVIITHMHFDHVGGAVKYDNNQNLIPTFPNAKYHISKQQWDWAENPNQREKPSYIKENIKPLIDHNVVCLVDEPGEIVPGISVRFFNGHTDGLMVPIINYNNKIIAYTADLLTLSAQIPPSWVCGFDTRPLISFEERTNFLTDAWENNYYLVFQHDFYTEVCTLEKTERGYKLKEAFKLEEIL